MLQKSQEIPGVLTETTDQSCSIDLEDLQHFLMSRPPARAARYEFLSFRKAKAGHAWLTGLIDKVGTAKAVGSNVVDSRWVTIGFTCSGLRAFDLGEASLATFPEEFRQGMATRADMLGLTGANHPSHWVGGLASPDLHAIAILFARDVAERRQRRTSFCTGPGSDSTIRLRSRTFRLPRSPFAASHRGSRSRTYSWLRPSPQAGRILPWLSR